MFKLKSINYKAIPIKPVVGLYFRYGEDKEYFRITRVNGNNWECTWIPTGSNIKNKEAITVGMNINNWESGINDKLYILITEINVPEEYRISLKD